MRKEMKIEEFADMARKSGAHAALMLMGKLGHLTNKGMRLAEEFTDSLLQIIR